MLKKISEVHALKSEIEEIYEKAKYASESAGREVLSTINVKANEIIEMWRSLRLKLESDYDLLNAKINNRLEMLRSDENVS